MVSQFKKEAWGGHHPKKLNNLNNIGEIMFKKLQKLFDEMFYLAPLEVAMLAALITFVFWGFWILLFSLEVATK